MERPIISFDYAIKDILRDKANFDILSGFLSELLEKPVTVQEVLESEGNTSRPTTVAGKSGKTRKVKNTGKVSRLDLKAKIDDGEIAYYEADKIAMGIQKSQLQTAELKGEKRGREEGREEGLEEATVGVVIRGHKKGHSIDTIAEFTGLATEQIIKILKENGLM